jgi:deoxyxylulose-5-phosphate synthase
VFFSGTIGEIALEARNMLLSLGISLTVVSIPFINRLDQEYLLEIDGNKPIVVLEEHMLKGGLGSAMLEDFNKLRINVKIEHFAIEDLNLELNGSGEFLRKEYGLSVDNLVNYFLKQ